MPINCRICGEVFKSIVHGNHIRKHGMTSPQYRGQFGQNSMAAPEYKSRLATQRSQPAYHDKMCIVRQKTHSTEAYREKISVVMKKAFEDPEIKRRHWEVRQTEEYKRNQSLAQLRPEVQAKKSKWARQQMQKYWSEAPVEERVIRIQASMEAQISGFQRTVYVKSDGKSWIFCRSSYEFEACKLLAEDQTVLDFESAEKFSIRYELNGETSLYLPDFLVEYKDGSKVLIEVKPQALVNDPDVVAKATAAQLFCQARGWFYQIWTEQQLKLVA